MTIRIPPKFLLFVLYTAALLGGAFGISYAVFEWRDGETAETNQSQPSPTPGIDAAGCQAAVALFEAIDAVLERANNPTENLREEWGRAARNMDERCFVPTPTPSSN